MTYSINNSVSFSAIDWDSLENRPQINDTMTFCDENNWDDPDAKCCMDGYSIEGAIHEGKFSKSSPEGNFLNQYPCVNGMELEMLAESTSRPTSKNPIPAPSTPTPSKPDQEDTPCSSDAIKAFVKVAKKLGLGKNADIINIGKEQKISCDSLLGAAFKYGALAFQMGTDPQKKLFPKTN